MKQLETALFAILRSALGMEVRTSSVKLAPQGWKKLFEVAAEQKVAALVYHEIEAKGYDIPDDIRQEWKSHASFSAGRFDAQLMVLNRLAAGLETEGIKMTVLKGLGLALCYPKPELRECADIDIYCHDLYERVNDFILDSGLGKNATGGDGNVPDFEKGFEIGGILVENHRKFCAGTNHAASCIDKILTEMSRREPYGDPRVPGIVFPSVQMGALHLIMHTLSHLAWSGIALRNLCDVTVYLDRHRSEIDFEQLRNILKDAGIEKSSALLIDICKRYLGLAIDLSSWDRYEKDASEAVLHGLFHPIAGSALTRNPFCKFHRKVKAFRYRKKLHCLVYGEEFPDSFTKSFAFLRKP